MTYKILGLAVIVALYIAIGIMAALGTISIFRKIFTPRAEQVFYAMFLVGVAAIYLAFAAYFEAGAAWRIETTAVIVFFALGLLGMRSPTALMLGYCMHGLWDFIHELQAHGVHFGFEPAQLTAIPLAYGFFCAAYDFYMAFYFFRRREDWASSRQTLSH